MTKMFCLLVESLSTIRYLVKQNYSDVQKEYLAVCWALQILRPYLTLKTITLTIDHNSN